MKKILYVSVIVLFVVNSCVLLASESPKVIIQANVRLEDLDTWVPNSATDCSKKWKLFGIECDNLVDQVTPVIRVGVEYRSSHKDGGYKSWMDNVPAAIWADIKYRFPRYVPQFLFFDVEDTGKKLREEPVLLQFEVREKKFEVQFTVTNKEKVEQILKQTPLLTGRNICRWGMFLAIVVAAAVYFCRK